MPENDTEAGNKTLKHYENHPSVSKIKSNQNEPLNFLFLTAKIEDTNKIIESLNPRVVTGPDGIPVKVLKIAGNVIDSHLTNIINRDLKERPVSILNGFSKVYERYVLNSLSNHIEKNLSNFIAAHRKTYSSSHVLIRVIENWKKHLDLKKIVGTVLMDLSNAFAVFHMTCLLQSYMLMDLMKRL